MYYSIQKNKLYYACLTGQNPNYIGIFFVYVKSKRRFVQTKRTQLPVSKTDIINTISEEEFIEKCNSLISVGEYVMYRGKSHQVKQVTHHVLVDGKLIPGGRLKKITKEKYENYVLSKL